VNLGPDARRQCARDKGQFRVEARSFSHVGECLYLAFIDSVTSPPEVMPRCPGGWDEVMHNSKRLIEDSALGICDAVAHIHVIVIIRVEAADLAQGRASR
jgi:hypothetical protein